jgi:enoyl-CoA hydratase
VSLACMPVTAEMAEKWGLANHIVEDSRVLSKAIEVAEAIARNNRNLVVLYKSVINDGLQLDMKHARALEKVRMHDTITYPWLNLQPIFVV